MTKENNAEYLEVLNGSFNRHLSHVGAFYFFISRNVVHIFLRAKCLCLWRRQQR